MSAIFLMLALGGDPDDLVRAREAFAEGVRLRLAGQRSRSQFVAAAEECERLLANGPASPSLYRGLGNAQLLAGDLPRAILAYRLGLRLDPTDAALRRCLQTARSLVIHREGSALGQAPQMKRLPLPPGAMPLIAGMMWLVACVALLRWLMLRLRKWLVVGLAFLAAALLCAALLAVEAMRPAPRRLAVVAVDGLVLRKGDGEQFPPRHEQPLGRGVEALIIHTRGNWLLIEVSGGAGWVPASKMACEAA